MDGDELFIIGVKTKGYEIVKLLLDSTIVITHYQRLLDHIIPDHVHVLQNGKIAKSGDKNLALQLEERGSDWI